MSSLASPERVWWKPLIREEKVWVTVALLWGFFMFAWMIIWPSVGKQEIPVETYRVTVDDFSKSTAAFNAKYTVRTEKGMPVVRPPAGADVYLVGRTWQWSSILELKKGSTYRVHISSEDLQHGFSLQPVNLNFQVLPGYDYVITLTPDKAGEYQIVCNEFCGIGHNLMIGKITVTE